MPQTEEQLPAITQTQAPSKTPSVPAENQLSGEGPWILLSTESGLWGMNEDGSGLTQFTTEPILAPSDLKIGISQESPHFAYITVGDPVTLQGLKLNLLKLPEGSVEFITPLTSANTEPQPNAELCDPKYEAARALTIGNSLQWSPDGAKLAFIGAQQGDTADLYVYTLADGSITRLSDEPAQAYDIHWSGDSRDIVYFGASCFGTGAGFNMEGVWAYRFDDARVVEMYKPSSESYGEKFIAWLFNENKALYVATQSGCPLRDLRLVDLDTQAVTSIHEGCFEDVAVGPTAMLAVLTSSDFSDQPGLYIYGEPNTIPPVFVSEPNGRKVEEIAALFFFSVFTDQGVEICSVNFDGEPGWYQSRGDFPAVSRDGEAWAWNEGGVFHLKSKGLDAPVKLSAGNAMYPFWYEELGPSGEIYQRLIFFNGEEPSKLYLVTAPDYRPILLASDLKPLSAPAYVWP